MPDEEESRRRSTLCAGIAQSLFASAALAVTVYLWQSENFDGLAFLVFASFCCGTTLISGSLGMAASITLHKVLINISAVVSALNCFAIFLVYIPVQLYLLIARVSIPEQFITAILLNFVGLTQICLLSMLGWNQPSSSSRTVPQQTGIRSSTTETAVAAGRDAPAQLESGAYVVSTGNSDYPGDAGTTPPDVHCKVEEDTPEDQRHVDAAPPVYPGCVSTSTPPYPGSVDAAPPVYPGDMTAVPSIYPGDMTAVPSIYPGDMAAVPPIYPGE